MVPLIVTTGLPLHDGQQTGRRCPSLKQTFDPHCSQFEKKWTKVKDGVCNTFHKGVERMLNDNRFSTVEELRDAWGVQPINVKVRLFQYVSQTKNLDLWKVQVDDNDHKRSTEAWCFFDSKWNDFFSLEKDCHLALFGAGLIGFHDNIVNCDIDDA